MSKKTTKKVAKTSGKKTAKASTKKSTARKTFDIENIPQPLGGSVEVISFRKYEYAMLGIRLFNAFERKDRFCIPVQKVLLRFKQLEKFRTDNAKEALAQKELLEFAEERLKNQIKAFKTLAEQGVVQFEHLWLLFEEQQEVVFSDTGVEMAGICNECAVVETFRGPMVLIKTRYLKHDGQDYEWCEHNATIPVFDGVKEIESLSVRPLDASTKERFIARGKKIASHCEQPSYLMYEGNAIRRAWWGTREYRSHGRCMIDAKTFSMMNSNYDTEDATGDTLDAVPENLLHLLNPWVMGFSFTSKVWGEFNIEHLDEIQFNSDAYDKLVLPERTMDGITINPKVMIKSLVERGAGSFSDLISGKGGGIIFLLHGPPGVGKTLSAEAVADLLERPLYTVSVGELGTDTSELEANLRQVLEVATLWNAVLLLDEADIFLEKRSSNDIERNAMVGIFLRMLEYYQGVLFLTTNRVRDFDPAFNSRISIALHYPDLNQPVRLQIWKNLLECAGVDAQTLDLNTLSKYDINGRQIKNAIRIGMSLAAEDGRALHQDDVLKTIKLGEAFNADLQDKVVNKPGTGFIDVYGV